MPRKQSALGRAIQHLKRTRTKAICEGCVSVVQIIIRFKPKEMHESRIPREENARGNAVEYQQNNNENGVGALAHRAPLAQAANSESRRISRINSEFTQSRSHRLGTP